jgi:hypothetical protein
MRSDDLAEVLGAIDRDRGSFVSAQVRARLAALIAERRRLEDPHTAEARELIDAERGRQDARWGRQDHDPQVWMAILGEEFGDLCQAANDLRWPKGGVPQADPFRHALVEAVQTAAVAQAVVECLLRADWRWPRPPAAAGETEARP